MNPAQDALLWDRLVECNTLSKRDAAIRYAQLGLHVIPLHNVLANGACSCDKGLACPSKGKHPLGGDWFSAATRDPQIVADTWGRAPDANIGVVPARSGHVLLDLDVKRTNDGMSFFAGAHEHAPGPAAVTPSGGAHRLFRKTDACPPSTSRKDFGFDWMSTSGQFVVAPSVTERGVYRWTRGGAPAPTPGSVHAKLREAQETRTLRQASYDDAPPVPGYGPEDALPGVELNVPKGERSEALYGLASTLWQRGHTAGQIMATLLATQAGMEKARDESGAPWLWRYTVWSSAEHLGGYDRVTEKLIGGFRGFDPIEPEDAAPAGGAMSDWFAAAPVAQRLEIDLLDFSRIDVDHVEPVEFLLPGWLPKGIMTSLYASDGSGKTTWLMQQAMLVACEPESDEDYDRGMRGEKVVLMTAEDLPTVIRHRVRAIAQHYGIAPRRWAHNLLIPDLMDADVKWAAWDRDNRMSLLPFAEYAENLVTRSRAAMFGLDPISDIYEDEENVRNRVAPFIRSLNRFCYQTGTAGVLVGHPAKSEGSTYSGSGAWSSKVRSRLFMRKEEVGGVEIVVLSQEKSSYGPRMPERRYVFTDHGVLQEVGAEILQQANDDQVSEARQVILDGLRWAGVSGLQASNSPASRTYLPRILIETKRDGGFPIETLRDAMASLIADGFLRPDAPLDGTNGSPRLFRANRQPKMGLWFSNSPKW